MANTNMVPLKGSERNQLAGARAIGPTDPHQIIEVSVVLRHRNPLPMNEKTSSVLTNTEFAKMYGAEPMHLEKIREFARQNNLQLLERGDELVRRTVTLAGTAAAMEKAFSVELTEYDHPEGSYRGRTGAIQIPADCASIIQGVFGLDNRPAAQPQVRFRSTNAAFGARISNTSYTPLQVAKLYNFPTDANGAGQTIGIIELGGGYRPTDLQQYFQSLELTAPQVKSVSVDHGNNRPSTAQSADGEVMLDIEVAGAIAPAAAIAVYFAPNTDRGFQDALSIAIHDEVNRPSVISISWGSAESTWTAQSMETFDAVAQEAALLGVTITVAAGDNGSSDGVNDGKNHVDFPASSPHVLAVGGTRLVSANGVISSETVWNDGPQGGATGGGYSAQFSRPAWQAAVVTQPNRGVPDVAGDADPATGYNVLVDGQQIVVGGTSAVAPLWAGLIALLNQKLNTRLGFISPALYEINQSEGFRAITQGNNGAYSATPGWNPCAGLGSPIGNLLLETLQESISQAPAATRSTSAATSRERTHAGGGGQ